MQDTELTAEERTLVRPRKRRARPYFRLVCLLLVAATIPFPWAQYTGCDAHGHARTEILTGKDVFFHDPASAAWTLVALTLALVTPWLAPRLARGKRIALHVICAGALALLTVGAGFCGPLLNDTRMLPAGDCGVALLLVMTVDACAELRDDARLRTEPPEADDSG